MPEISIDSDSILNVQNQKYALVEKNFFNNEKMSILSWNRIFNLFRIGRSEDAVQFHSFGTCSINIDKINNDSELFTFINTHIIDKISKIYSSNKISSQLSVSFIGKNENFIKDDDALEFKKVFESFNPYPVPKNFPPKEIFDPPTFFYPTDIFFVQLQGSSIWKIKGTLQEEEYILNSGDIIFIHKNLNHSVEYLSPGSIASISFSD